MRFGRSPSEQVVALVRSASARASALLLHIVILLVSVMSLEFEKNWEVGLTLREPSAFQGIPLAT